MDTALAHLDSRNPGPSVIDGAGNRVCAILGCLAGRRTVVTIMHRMTDPDRRAPRKAAAQN